MFNPYFEGILLGNDVVRETPDHAIHEIGTDFILFMMQYELKYF